MLLLLLNAKLPSFKLQHLTLTILRNPSSYNKAASVVTQAIKAVNPSDNELRPPGQEASTDYDPPRRIHPFLFFLGTLNLK